MTSTRVAAEDRPRLGAQPSAQGVGPVRVLVISAVRLYRDGLVSALADREEIDVVGAVADVGDVLSRGTRPDAEIVLLDLAGGGDRAAVEALNASAPEVGVVVLAVPEVDADVIAYAEAGVAGYVTRDQALDDVAAVIQGAARGELVCSPRIAAALLRRVASAPSEGSRGRTRLTPREREIAHLLRRGLSNKQIARALSIEVATVKNHVHNILEKLHVTRRGEAAARLRATGPVRGSGIERSMTL